MQHSGSPGVLFLSHGGGPMPLMDDPGHQEMVSTLQRIAGVIPKPSAVIVVSAHWEMPRPSITHAASPPMIYDYYGFPDAAYRITYPAAGSPALADSIRWTLNRHGFDARLDDERGFDHGVYVPLKLMYPDADIPCVQLSLIRGLDPAAHIRMGQALAALEVENLLIVGSGFSFHNMEAFFSPSGERTQRNDAFQSWLIETCTDSRMPENARTQRLVEWERAPYARFCHPRAEHLLPLHVCYGAAGRACDQRFEPHILGVRAGTFLWKG
jgi:4,5-DOPA dioxygenase extradiol